MRSLLFWKGCQYTFVDFTESARNLAVLKVKILTVTGIQIETVEEDDGLEDEFSIEGCWPKEG